MNTDIKLDAPTHVLLTRYNLCLPGLNLNLDNDWLKHRFELFVSLCLPSIVGQDTQDFRWFVLVDSHTPGFRLRELEEVLPTNAQLLSIDGYLDDNPLIESLERAGLPTVMPLLTSRLDNDDAVGKSFMSAMYKAALKTDPGIQTAAFNMPIGMQIKLGKVYGLIDFDNPFMSLLERTPTKITVLGVSHRRLKHVARIRQILLRPQWMQIVHRQNLDNRIRGVRLPRRVLRKSFPAFPHLWRAEPTGMVD